MTAVLLLPCVAGIVVAFWLLRRNQRVLAFRLDLLRQAGEAAQADIDAGNFNWRWRYDALNDVSYERQLWSLRPLRPENYYDDLAFLRRSS